MKRTIAILQARMGSTRLPGKVMQDLAGKPLLQRVIERASGAHYLDGLVIATTENASDDVIATFCAEQTVACFRGDEQDVLDRYYRAASVYQADVVVRLTADCPLLDPNVTDQVIQAFQAGDFDYVSNSLEPTFPDGLDTEVFSMNALARAWRDAKLKSQREHVTPYICDHPDLFRLGNVRNATDLSWMRWTVDEPRDLEFVRRVYEYFGDDSFGMNDLVRVMAQHPDWMALNAGIERNEGYAKSLLMDAGQKD